MLFATFMNKFGVQKNEKISGGGGGGGDIFFWGRKTILYFISRLCYLQYWQKIGEMGGGFFKQ